MHPDEEIPIDSFHPGAMNFLITLFSPFDDTVALGNITIAGNVSDPWIANGTVAVNGVNTSFPVTGFNFSTVLNVTTPATLVVSANGTVPVTVLLDGDYLP